MSSLRSIVQSRRTSNTLIGIFLVWQLALPISYYLRHDVEDERFAWRMFSAVRLQRCEAYAFDHNAVGQWRRVDLRTHLHPAWRSLIAKSRATVTEAFLRHRCRLTDAHQTKVETFCKGPWTEAHRRSETLICRPEKQL